MEKEFKKIDLNDLSTFEDISINDKIKVDNLGKEIDVLVIRKNKNNFYGAYRNKDLLEGDTISVNTYHLYPGKNIENFGADNHFKEEDNLTRVNYQKHDRLMKRFGM
jgi:hypothetical protein